MLADRLVAAWYSPRLTPLARRCCCRSRSCSGCGVALRRALYRVGVLRAVRLPVPVVVVGNITVGGSGKTPLVAALAAALAQRGWQPGHREPRLRRRRRRRRAAARRARRRSAPRRRRAAAARARRLPGRRRARPRRRRRARSLRAIPRCDVILADDGLQHYGLARERRDRRRRRARAGSATAGCCRPARCASRASRLDEVDAVVDAGGERGSRRRRRTPRAFAMRARRRSVRAGRRSARRRRRRRRSRGADVHAVAGIGHPERFFAQLARAGHRGDAASVSRSSSLRRRRPRVRRTRSAILMTEKDAVKCEAFADERCWYLPVRAQRRRRARRAGRGKIRGPQAA